MKFKVGDLVQTGYGMAIVMKFLAPKYISALLMEGPDRGRYIYLRGYDLTRVEVISECG